MMTHTQWVEFVHGGPMDGEWRPIPQDVLLRGDLTMAVVAHSGHLLGFYELEGDPVEACWHPMDVDPPEEEKPWS